MHHMGNIHLLISNGCFDDFNAIRSGSSNGSYPPYQQLIRCRRTDNLQNSKQWFVLPTAPGLKVISQTEERRSYLQTILSWENIQK